MRTPTVEVLRLCAAVLLAQAACGGPPAPSAIRIAHEADVISLDPTTVAESATHSILSNVYESLVAFDREMRLVPALAVEWSVPDDHTWLLGIRKGVRFHDGATLTPADAKVSLDRARGDPASGIRGQLSSLSGVEILGESTLRLRTVRPDPLLLNRLTYVLISRRSASPGAPSALVGTGPYKVVRWEKGKALEADAFPEYWGGRPAIEHVRFTPVEEGDQSILALKEGRVDVLRPLPETLADRARSLPGVRIRSRAGLTSYYLWFSSKRPEGRLNPFSDARVRRSISLAIDRGKIIERLRGNGVPAHQLVQQGIFGYVASLPELPFDPGESRRLLKESGYGDGFETTLAHRPSASVAAAAEVVRDMLGEVAIRVTLETQDWSSVVAKLKSGEVPLTLAAWRFENGDATSFLKDCLFTRDPARGTGSYNPGYSNPALDRLIDENGQLFGEANRLRHYEKLVRLAMEEMPLVPLYHRHDLYGVGERVRWEPRLDGMLLAFEMSWVRR